MGKPISFIVAFFCSFQSYGQHCNGQLVVSNLIVRECVHMPTKNDTISVGGVICSMCQAFKIRRILIVENKTGSSHFNPFNRTMYLNIKDTNDLCRVLMNEVSHAEQFAVQPVFYSILFLRGFIETFRGVFSLSRAERAKVRMLKKQGCSGLIARFWVVYERQEFIKGTAEYNAHKIRQPRIERMFYSLIAKRN